MTSRPPTWIRPSSGSPGEATDIHAEILLSAEDLATAAGISRATVTRAVRLGLVEPMDPDGSTFTAAAAARLRRMCRLHADLGVSLVAASIIVDLVARLDHLEERLARLRGHA